MKRTVIVCGLFASAVLAGCAAPNPAANMTQLQIRELQTRTYRTSNTIAAEKAVIGALQDMGFSVTNANTTLGLIVAAKDKDVENKTAAVFAEIFAGPNARYRKDAHLQATVNVTAFDGATRVRVSFALKVLDNKGGIMSTQQIVNPKMYQTFFQKVQQSVFLKQQGVG